MWRFVAGYQVFRKLCDAGGYVMVEPGSFHDDCSNRVGAYAGAVDGVMLTSSPRKTARYQCPKFGFDIDGFDAGRIPAPCCICHGRRVCELFIQSVLKRRKV